MIFAAASNNGNHSPVAWPARDSGHTICIHSCDDGGKRSSVFTPGVDPNTTNFMAIGENVRSHWPSSKGGGWHVMSGSSTATPVATAIGALLLAFINQSHWQEQRRTVENSVRLKRLRKVRCMTDLLKKISDQKVDGYYWIHSSLLWKDYKPDAEKRKDPASAADHAWEQIRLALLK